MWHKGDEGSLQRRSRLPPASIWGVPCKMKSETKRDRYYCLKRPIKPVAIVALLIQTDTGGLARVRCCRSRQPCACDSANRMAMQGSKRPKASETASVSVTQFIIASVLFQFCLSYVITETWTWGYKSKWMAPRSWKYMLVFAFAVVLNAGDTVKLDRIGARNVQWIRSGQACISRY
jgi:hypothetical protein